MSELILNFNRRVFYALRNRLAVLCLGMGILISIGFLGLILSPAIPPRILRAIAVMISVLIILTGIYFSYQWSAQRKGIQVLTQQAEETIKQYLAAHPKK